MKITNEFTVHTPIDRAWRMLTDLEGVAPCLPGAQLTGVEGDVYQGKVKVKVGPVISEFAGTARFTERDETAYRGVIDAKGRDARSAGNASAVVTAVLRPDGDRTTVSVDTDLKISGKLAQFGSGMIKEVSGKLLAQFVANLEAKLAAEETPASPSSLSPSLSSSSSLGSSAAEPVAASAAAVETVAGTGVSSADVEPSAAGSASDELSPAPGVVAAKPVTSITELVEPTPFTASAEPEPLDLLDIAGGSVYKRLIPVVAGVVVVGAVVAWLIARR